MRLCNFSFGLTVLLLFCGFAANSLVPSPTEAAEPEKNSAAKWYYQIILSDEPIAYWRLNDADLQQILNAASAAENEQLNGRVEGHVRLQQIGARPDNYPRFDQENLAAAFGGQTGYIRVSDPGSNSRLDFNDGDTITLEAWVKPNAIPEGQQVYIVGKGRTNNPGVSRENQNYALRLRGMGGTARVSFLYRSVENRAGTQDDFHRWNSDLGFLPDENWHHVAVTYTFGVPKSIKGFVDGQEVSGTWDLGGASDKAPVVDDDELWIGSSMGGNPGSTFDGLIDEVAIYRKPLDIDRIRARYQVNLPDPREAELADADLPDDRVLVEIHEGIPANDSWNFARPRPTDSYEQSAFAFIGLPKKYSSKALIADRTNPFLVRARTKRTLPPGDYQFMLRAKSAARLYIDGKLVTQANFMSRNASGHEPVPDLPETQHADLYPLAPGHQEQVTEIGIDEGEHVFRLEVIVGGKGLRAEIGEVCVAVARRGEPFGVLTAAPFDLISLDEESWTPFAEAQRNWLHETDANTRRTIAEEEAKYWQQRHQVARRYISERPSIAVPAGSSEKSIHNDIDRFINEKLDESEAAQAPLAEDYAFLRRVTLDTIGIVPSRDEIAAFINDQNSDRRAGVIDRLLDDPRWADNWVGYWQDVLAENPGILKPTLNNTGPFRWWIYESLLDNKPMDRFVTELVMMEGSLYGGSPSAFAIATQNDVPMAAKAHVISQAFLGLEMKCARCHDAPYHEFKQADLFGLAAMLDRKPITLPESSTVPVSDGGRRPVVDISIKPGEKIQPAWPFDDLASIDATAGVLRNRNDQRERLAAIITSPRNERFAQVIVNRLWQRYMGVGLVEPVDDWEAAEPSHPELLDFLGREFVAHGYDLKHVARLILNSHTYQRAVQTDHQNGATSSARLFAGQTRRRMTAEQVVDSLYAAAGKQFDAEQLTLDPEGRRPDDTFLNLGEPRRAWQFTSLSNERDRPALALPVAQSIVDVLSAFGWRDSRPNPITVREEEPTMIQPLTLANGIAGHRVTKLSDNSGLTELCLEEQPVEQLVDDLFLQILSRPPSSDERAMIAEVLADGYEARLVASSNDEPQRQPRRRNAVSWSNHLSPEATQIKLELERAAREGDPPTARLDPRWRERMEDVVWSLFNSPEFVFVP